MSRPARMADVISELFARRGYARVQAAETYLDAWEAAAGAALARYSRLLKVRRGVAEVLVAHSALAQEMTFEKERIVARLVELLPEETIRDIKCRVGPVE